MIVVLTTAAGPIGVNPSKVRMTATNNTDTTCMVSFSGEHSIEVIGSLAKVQAKLNAGRANPEV